MSLTKFGNEFTRKLNNEIYKWRVERAFDLKMFRSGCVFRVKCGGGKMFCGQKQVICPSYG